MVNVIVDPLSDHVGYHILHWIISQSGAWYSKVNENLQDNLRSLETGVAVIDDILTPKEEEIPYENQQHVEAEEPRFHQGLFQNDNDHHLNILNQIINMNVNYNESSLESRPASFRRNPPSGNCLSRELCAVKISHRAHVGCCTISNSSLNSHGRLCSLNSLIDFSCFLVCEKKWTILNSLFNNGHVESLLENCSNETKLGAGQHVVFADALDQR